MVKIIYEKGSPFIGINGEKIAPAAFRSFRPKPDNISLMTRAGVKLCQMLVSGSPCTIGCPYSLFGGVWKGDGIYDFTPFDRQFGMFRHFAPDACFNVMIHLDTPDCGNQLTRTPSPTATVTSPKPRCTAIGSTRHRTTCAH